MAEQVNQDQELATEAVEVKETRTRKTPEEKKAAKRARAKARRLRKRAAELGLTEEEVLAQRKARKENAKARKAEKPAETQATPLQVAEALIENLTAKRNAEGLSDEEKKALKAAQDKARYYRNKEAA